MSSVADDIAMFWIGNYAYSGWSRSNADAIALQDKAITFQFNLDKGTYTALRFIYANGGGTSGDTVTITDPFGNIVLSGSTAASPHIVQYACDDKFLAPKFEPFQTEIETSNSPTARVCTDSSIPFRINEKTYTPKCDGYIVADTFLGYKVTVENYSDCIAYCYATPGCTAGLLYRYGSYSECDIFGGTSRYTGNYIYETSFSLD